MEVLSNHLEDILKIVGGVSIFVVALKLLFCGMRNAKFVITPDEIEHNRQHTTLSLAFILMSAITILSSVAHVYYIDFSGLPEDVIIKIENMLEITSNFIDALIFIGVAFVLNHIYDEEHIHGDWHDVVYRSKNDVK